MIERLIAFCLQQRLMVIGATLAIAVSGIVAFENLPVQAFPDVQNVFVQVVTQYPGHDHFRFVLEGGDKPPVTMNFPKHPIEINDDILAFVIEKLGEDNVLITEE